jgi:hypothetical protein
MLRSLNGTLGYKIGAEDDEFGKVADFYFDDFAWVIRYLVVDTGRWLPGRRVLINPGELGQPDWNRPVLPVSLTREQIEQGPPVSAEAPVSRESELLLAKYYGWSAYWQTEPLPERLGRSYAQEATADTREQIERQADSRLRSVREVEGYAIKAQDGDIGRVADAIAETTDWAIRYLVIDTSKWLPEVLSKRVLVSPDWASHVDWAQRAVHVALSREEVEHCPPYDPGEGVNRAYEGRLHDYYGRPKYWEKPAQTL